LLCAPLLASALLLASAGPAMAGNGLICEAVGDYAEGTGIPTTLTNVTLEAWVYHDAITNRIERYVTLGSGAAVLRMDGVSAPGQLHFYIKTTSGALRSLRANDALTSGAWQHVAGTWDGVTMRLYLNGNELTHSVPGGTLDAPDGTVILGGSSEYLRGRLDEARVWSVARTQGQIQSGMRVGLAGTEPGLAAYWRLDEASGTTAADSADGVNLTLHGNARFAASEAPVAYGGSGGSGNALWLSGTSAYVSIPNKASWNVGNTLTVEAWLKPSSLASRYGVFSTRRYNNAGSFQLEVGPGSGGTNRVAVSGVGTWVTQTGDNVIQPDRWTHIAYVRTGAGGTDTIYVNGVAQAVTTNSAYNFIDNAQVKVIGSGTGSSESGAGQLYPGQIDDLRVWNTARTADQIRDDMHLTLSGSETGLVACYACDQPSGATTLPDSTPNANNGSLALFGGSENANWLPGAFPCANLLAGGSNLRGVWAGNANSLGSDRLRVTDATAADPNFALFGHDGGADAWQTDDVPTDIARRLARVWRFEASGSASGKLVIDTTGLEQAGDAMNLRLLSSPDATFSHATIVSGSYSAPNLTLSSQALSNGNYYTLGSTPFVRNTTVSLPYCGDGSIAWGDYDNDGRLDLLMTGTPNGVTHFSRIYHNNGDGTFTEDTQADAGLPGVASYSSGVWGDYNNDGHLDFVLAGQLSSYSRITRIYRNNGDGTFTRDTQADAGMPGAPGAAWGDYDNDGKPDLVLSGYGTRIRIYHNNGDGTFTEDTQADAGLPVNLVGTVAWGDFNNDGFLDVLVSGSPSAIYRNDPAPHVSSDRVFTDIGAGLPSLSYSRAAWGDYDNDGRLDCVLQGEGGGTTAHFYHNNGDGTFTEDTEAEAALTWSDYGSLGWGDVDNDGRSDLLQVRTKSANSSGFCALYRNNPDGTFTDMHAGFPGYGHSEAVLGDYDNDGRLDVLLSGGSISALYRNTGPVSNMPPSGPSNLHATVIDGALTLSWDAAADPETPSAALTYNLRIGTAPGGSDVVSPLADPATGFRRVPAMGNVGNNRSWAPPSLPQGTTYY
jgi:hypothetical protein